MDRDKQRDQNGVDCTRLVYAWLYNRRSLLPGSIKGIITQTCPWNIL